MSIRAYRAGYRRMPAWKLWAARVAGRLAVAVAAAFALTVLYWQSGVI